MYQGPGTAATFRNFWSWPYWNTDSYYFHSNTGFGESSLRLRAFYIQFRNAINMYSTDAYTLMNTKSCAIASEKRDLRSTGAARPKGWLTNSPSDILQA